MTATLVVVTACADASYLAEAAESVAQSKEAARAQGWRLAWCVSFDGGSETARGRLDSLDGVDVDLVLHAPVHLGAAGARNRVLAHLGDLGADWVFPLDADDVLDAGEVDRLLAHDAMKDPTIGWVGTSRKLIDGEPLAFTFFAERSYARWELCENWVLPGYVHANSILARAEVLSAVGGWPAFVGHEDVALQHVLADTTDGIALPFHLIRYRSWEGQTIRQPWINEIRAENMDRLVAGANARRVLAGRPPCVRPVVQIERDSRGLPIVAPRDMSS